MCSDIRKKNGTLLPYLRTVRIWIAAGLLGFAAGCGSREPVVSETKPRADVIVTVSPVRFQNLDRKVKVVGSLKGWEEVTIGAKRFGRVQEIYHDMGDVVKPGEILAQLETNDARLAVLQAKKKLDSDLAVLGLKELPKTPFEVNKVTSVIRAKVAQDRAELKLARERKLKDRLANTNESFELAEIDQRSAVADLNNAIQTAEANLATALAGKVAVDVAEEAFKDLTIIVPTPTLLPTELKSNARYSITKRSITNGRMIRDGDEAFQLVIVDQLRLWANVPERYVSEIHVGQPAVIRVLAYPNTDFPAKVARINAAVDPSSRTFQVELAVPNGEGKLHPGGFATATISTGTRENAILVPLEAVSTIAGNRKVFLVNGQSAREVILQEVIQLDNPKGMAEIIPSDAKHFTPGTQVIVTGQSQLADQDRISIRTKEKEPAVTPPDAKTKTASGPDNGDAVTLSPPPPAKPHVIPASMPRNDGQVLRTSAEPKNAPLPRNTGFIRQSIGE